ncbi:MAG: hypothetical protein UW85_C0012G0017 [Parcubacteria group bacterium GW2011_GWA1_Parcubacteria_45_10]|nr:MAG: hypothetical protein UW85_C0012G0017 [Parcubacteria group bacterium GW2011_GWA1_Parcubacteria_45_10]
MAKLVTWECDCGGHDGEGCGVKAEFESGAAPDGWRFVTTIVATNNLNKPIGGDDEPKCGRAISYLAPGHHRGAKVQEMLLDAMNEAFEKLATDPKRLPR